MSNELGIIVACICGFAAGSVISCSFTLKRILNILKQMNGGEPTAREIKQIDAQNIKFK